MSSLATTARCKVWLSANIGVYSCGRQERTGTHTRVSTFNLFTPVALILFWISRLRFLLFRWLLSPAFGPQFDTQNVMDLGFKSIKLIRYWSRLRPSPGPVFGSRFWNQKSVQNGEHEMVKSPYPERPGFRFPKARKSRSRTFRILEPKLACSENPYPKLTKMRGPGGSFLGVKIGLGTGKSSPISWAQGVRRHLEK